MQSRTKIKTKENQSSRQNLNTEKSNGNNILSSSPSFPPIHISNSSSGIIQKASKTENSPEGPVAQLWSWPWEKKEEPATRPRSNAVTAMPEPTTYDKFAAGSGKLANQGMNWVKGLKDNVGDEFSVQNKTSSQLGRIGGLFGMGQQETTRPRSNAVTEMPQKEDDSIWGKLNGYYHKEKDSDEKSGWLKGGVQGALGTVGGILGGIGGGIVGGFKGLFGMTDEKTENGEKRKLTLWEQMKADAHSGGSHGRDFGRVAGAGIMDGTKALAGGAVGAATGLAGGLAGGLFGIGHGIYNKATGKGDFLNTLGKDISTGGSVGFTGGKGIVDATHGLVDEAPEMAMNLSRGALGAAGGVVGGLAGGVYGSVKGMFSPDRKYDENGVQSKENDGRNTWYEQAWQDAKSGANRGFDFGANSNLTKTGLGIASTIGATTLGGLAGPAGALAAGYAASRANARYWGATNTESDVTALSSLITTGIGTTITPASVAAGGGVTNVGLGEAVNTHAATYSALAANALGGKGIAAGSQYLEQNFAPEDRRSKDGEAATEWEILNNYKKA